MKSIEHPSQFIPGEFTSAIRVRASEAESLRKLHPDQLKIIMEKNWLNMFVPKEFGGLELPLPEGVRVEEGLSWADGSTGWVATLCSGAAWFSGFLPHDVLIDIFSRDHVCFAGSGAPTGTARVTENGYEVSGYWKYASGSLHATIFTANCVLTKNGVPVCNDDGSPLVRAFFFKKEEVILHFNWNGMGMVATGSHDFEIKSIHLDHSRCFIIDPKHAVTKLTLYQFPFLQLAEVTLAANLSGMAARFMDLCEILFEERIKHKSLLDSQATNLLQKLAEAQKNLLRCRQAFYNVLDTSWEINSAGNLISQDQLGEISSHSHQLAKASRQLVDELYPYCGLAAANTQTEINRVWRNLHTASQHALFTLI